MEKKDYLLPSADSSSEIMKSACTIQSIHHPGFENCGFGHSICRVADVDKHL